MTTVGQRRKSEAGRPRSGTALRSDLAPGDQILDAAAELFVAQGYAATSTRSIAEKVGMRQASLYYHFSNKEQMLDELLLRTVEPSMTMATAIAGVDASPAVRLYALIAFDAGQLAAAPHNVGTLYFLPEVRAERFERFRMVRARLQAVYSLLISQIETSDGAVTPTGASLYPSPYLTDVIFGMVESVIAIRADHPDDVAEKLIDAIAVSCFRVLGFGIEMIISISRAGSRLPEHKLAGV